MKGITRIAALGIALLFFFGGGALEAQAPERSGFWIGFGLGGGLNVGEGLDDDRLAGFAGHVRLGGTLSPRVLIGGEVIGWARERDDSWLSRGNGGAVLLFYPSETGTFFLKGGVGGASLSISHVDGATTTTTTRSGFGATGGLGVDVPLGRTLHLTPAVDWLFQAFSSDEVPGLGEVPGTNNIVLVTIGLTWH